MASSPRKYVKTENTIIHKMEEEFSDCSIDES